MTRRFPLSLATLLTNVAWYVVLAFLGLSVCLLLVSPWVDPPRIAVEFAVPAAFDLEAASHTITAPPDLQGVHLESTTGSLLFSPRSRPAVASGALVLMAVLGLVAWILAQVRAVLGTIRTRTPFVPANATRIRRVGYAVIAGEVLHAMLDYAGMRYAATTVAVQGLRLETRFDVSVLVIACGLIILVIAEVFREGTRLDEDQSLTV